MEIPQNKVSLRFKWYWFVAAAVALMLLGALLFR